MLSTKFSLPVMVLAVLLGSIVASPIGVRRDMKSTSSVCELPTQTVTVTEQLTVTLTASNQLATSAIPASSFMPAPSVISPHISVTLLPSQVTPTISTTNTPIIPAIITPEITFPSIAPTETTVTNGIMPSISTLIGTLPASQSAPAPVQTPAGAATPPQQESGQAVVQNRCSFPVLVQSVAGTDVGEIQTIAPGDHYEENYHNGPDGTGVAIKMIKSGGNWSTPMLLEYTPNVNMNMVFYDMSISVGGKESGNGGIGDNYLLQPSTINSAISCIEVGYDNSYTHLGEGDAATKSCPMSTTLTLQLC